MLQDHSILASRHERFVKTICDTGIVYALENEDGLATSSSNEIEDERGEPVDIICFWSERALADASRESDWSEYEIVEIGLSEFIEDWCVGMSNDGLIIGSNFDANMFGLEVNPFDLMLQVIGQLKEAKKTLTFEKYKSLSDLEQQLRDAMEED